MIRHVLPLVVLVVGALTAPTTAGPEKVAFPTSR